MHFGHQIVEANIISAVKVTQIIPTMNSKDAIVQIDLVFIEELPASVEELLNVTMAIRTLLAPYKEHKLCDVFQVSDDHGVQCRYGLIFDDPMTRVMIMEKINQGITDCFWMSMGIAQRAKGDKGLTWYERARKNLESHQNISPESLKSPREQNLKRREIKRMRKYMRKSTATAKRYLDHL